MTQNVKYVQDTMKNKYVIIMYLLQFIYFKLNEFACVCVDSSEFIRDMGKNVTHWQYGLQRSCI